MSYLSPPYRRNFWIRTIAGITGDVAIGVAMSSACIWVIQSATLGLFLSFLLWIVTILLSLALSQHVVRPAVQFALSDKKLDRGLEVLSSLAGVAAELAADLGVSSPTWLQLRRRGTRFATRFATK